MKARCVFLAAMVGLTAFIGGCCEKENARIKQLMADNDAMAEQLRLANDQLDGKAADLSKCRDELSGAQNRLSGLQADLDKARKQPALPEGWEMQKGMAMTSLPDKVLFDPGKAALKSQASGRLDRIVDDIRKNFAGRDVYIIGHTDSDPIRKSGWRDNLELSLQRAAEVARYLIRQGMDTKQVVAGGCGEHRPVASNASSDGKAKNRRVEFWILKPM